MSQCITADPTTLDVDTLEVGVDSLYTVRVNSTTPKIKITFAPPRTQDSSGSVDGVVVTPSGPDHGTDWVEFTTDHLDTTYTIEVSYTNPPPTLERALPPPLETPTKSPKFKPRLTCPTSEE